MPFTGFRVMTDTQFVSDKPMTFSCDLDLGRGNLIFLILCIVHLLILLYVSLSYD